MRNIKSAQALKSFEAAARYLSFKCAAEELFVSPTAISHQIKSLERQLNCTLFERKARQVSLTRPGQILFNTLRKAFNDIDDSINEVESYRQRPVVALGLGPIIGTHWLAPRLGDFRTKHQSVDLQLHNIGFTSSSNLQHFDLAIAWGNGYWPSMNAVPFINIRLTPVLSPRLKQPAIESDLLDYPLIHQRDRNAWQQWFRMAKVEQTNKIGGTVIDDSNLVLQTALDGQGVALGILPFVESEINEKKLVMPFDLSMEPDNAYYLICRKSCLRKPEVMQVYEWLCEQM